MRLIESSGFEQNSNDKLDLPSLHSNIITNKGCDGFIFVFNKYVPDSLNHLFNFISQYRLKVVGKKYFPCVFVQDELTMEGINIDLTPINNKAVKKITENYNFPLVKIPCEFNKIEIAKVLNQIITQIMKEKKDEFPYNIIFNETYKLNCCMKYAKNLYYINLVIFTLVLVK
jgi:hypothetical protein